MTEVATEQTEGWDEEQEQPAPQAPAQATYPEYPSNPHNHRYTLSYDPQKAPFLVVRANTVEELQASFKELEDGGVYAAMGNAWRVMKAQASVGAGLGPTTAVPAAPAAPGAPAGPPPGYAQGAQAQQYPPQYGPQAPGTAPAGWQNAGAPAAPPAPPAGGAQAGGSRDPKPRPNWPQVYKISIRRGDSSFKDYRAANQQYFKGKVQWAGGGDYWIHGEVAQAVANWNPVPA